jgi:heat shock protein HtpX
LSEQTIQNAPLVHTFTIETELSRQQLLSFPRFMMQNLTFGQLPGLRLGPVEALVSSRGHYLEFIAGPDRGPYAALTRIYLDRPLSIELRSQMGRDEAFEKQLSNVLLMTLQFFEEEARKSTLYLAFLPGSPKTAEVTRRRSLLRMIFSGNLLNLFLLIIVIGITVFAILGLFGLEMYAPFTLLGIMTVLVLSAGRLASLRSPWKITKDTREIVLVQHKIPDGELENYRTKLRDKVSAAKRKAYDTFGSCPGLVCVEKISDIFVEAGLPADKDDFLVKRIDLYGIVERAAAKFNMPMPTVIVTQDINPNAAATGFTKSLATMLITLGLLVQLDEEEIEVVVGHELSHLQSGDPIVLFSLVATEYLARVYVYGHIVAPFFLFYIIGVFWLIFFFGKFLETRADLEAALILRKPKVMAESLKKIGFRRLVLSERYLEPEASRFGEWLRFDPHPPLSFRIDRLESLDIDNPPRHPFLRSVSEVISSFLGSGRA